MSKTSTKKEEEEFKKYLKGKGIAFIDTTKAKPGKGLNKTEKKETKAIVKKALKNQESKYGTFWQYDNIATYSAATYTAGPLNNPVPLPGIDVAGLYVACTQVLQTGEYLSAASIETNTAFGATPVSVMGGYKMLQYAPLDPTTGQPAGTTAVANKSIDGDFAYAKSHRISMRICMNQINSDRQLKDCQQPCYFRILYVKAKSLSGSQSASLAGALFIDERGQRQGLASAGSIKNLMVDWKVNKDQWMLKKEIKFKLNNPANGQFNPNNVAAPQTDPVQTYVPELIQNQPNTAYPSDKLVDLYLEKPKRRLKFNQTTVVGANDYEVTNYDTTSYIIILSGRGGNGGGTFASNQWSLLASGTSKFVDA